MRTSLRSLPSLHPSLPHITLPFRHKLRILFVASEEAPFAQVGGLGEVMFSLPRALQGLGHDARVMIPRYGTVDLEKYHIPIVLEGLAVPAGPRADAQKIICNVRAWTPNVREDAVVTYFLENQEYYELRSNVYGYKDDPIRFALLSRGALEFLRAWRAWKPDVIVTADYMTGYLPNFLATDYREDPFLKNVTTVFSIHNLKSQGTPRPYRFLAENERDEGRGPVPDILSEEFARVNGMRRGIMHADAVNTVSPRYAQEILTEEFGEGLEGLLAERKNILWGILNGIDEATRDPATDVNIKSPFTSRTLSARQANKRFLQERFDLAQKEEVFVMGIVSRLTKQKGFDLLPPVIEQFLTTTDAQLIVMGTGDTEIMDFFQGLEKRFPEQVRAHLQFEPSLSRVLYGGADVILIPSAFEPCGLTQMEAMRFGAIPVAHNVGGLADTIEDYRPETGRGTGFLFDEQNPEAFLIALTRAFTNWRHHDAWRKLQQAAMQKDFSWERSAKEYVALFRRAMNLHRASRQ